MDILRRQSFEEIISLKKERDDLGVKVQQLEKELYRTKRKLRAAQGSVSKSKEIKNGATKTYEELKHDLSIARTTERRLKDEITHREVQFDEERKHMRDIVKREKLKLNKYQEETLKSKDLYEKNKNKIIKEMIEKDEIIHKLNNELNDIKSIIRAKEIMSVENKLKDSMEKSFTNYNSHDQKHTSSRDFTRSKSPFLNENNISETIMYGGNTSVIDSMIGLFPNEKMSIIASQDIDFRQSKKQMGQNKGKHYYIHKTELEDVQESELN